MYPKSDEVIQQLYDLMEVAERRAERSKDYLETEREIGLKFNELLLLVSPKEQGTARAIFAEIAEYYMHLYNLTLREVVCSCEFVKIDDEVL